MFTEKSWKNFKVFAGAFCVVALTPFFGINSSVHAADTVVIRYGPIEESVSLEELKKSTETGKLPDSLGSYTKRMTEEQRRFLVEGLKIRIPINVATLDSAGVLF